MATMKHEVNVTEFGFLIVKMNPPQSQCPFASSAAIDVLDCIFEFGAIPAVHYGGDSRYTAASSLPLMANGAPQRPSEL